jgi:simple sugar transport system substrate-binding protein/ribose transport system substrate-binding protein
MSINDSSFLAGGYTSDDKTNAGIVGGEAAKFIKANIKGEVNIGVIDFDSQLPDQSKARWGGFLDALKAAGVEYKKVAAQSAWKQDTALAAATDMLTANPNINVIWASNEGGTIGAAMAVKQAGKAGKVFVFGYDGSDQLTSMILSNDNILQGAVAQDPYAMGYKAVEALVATLTGKPGPDAGKMTIVNGTYLGRADLPAVNAWRKANGLKEIEISAAPAAPAAPAMEAKDITIAGVVFQDDQFMNSMVQGYKDAAAKLGVKVLTANTDNDQAKETELIQTYISQKVSGIAIAPLSKDASIANLKQANDKGIKVAITNMSINDSSFLAGGYTSDDKTNAGIVGGEAAKFVKANIKGDVVVGVIDFDSQLPDQSKARWGGFLDALKAGGVEYKKVAAQSAWKQDTALAAATDMLTANPNINIIWASNEGGTIGATMAVKQAGKAGKVFVFGYDGSDQLTSMILSDDNILQGAVAQDPYTMGYKAVESLVMMLMGKPGPDAGKMTIVNGTYLGRSNVEGVKAWRAANGLK